jgi:putative redox protein
METSKIKYVGNLRTSAVHLKSQNTIITDAPTDNHGKGEAFSPTDLLSTSLGSCMLTIMGIVAGKNDITFNNAEVGITKIMGTSPRRVTEVHVVIEMPRENYSDEQKKLLENAALNCPVAKSLHPDLIQKVSFIYN